MEFLHKEFLGSDFSFVGVQDKTVNWYSTPFETRLERALNRGSAGYSTQKS